MRARFPIINWGRPRHPERNWKPLDSVTHANVPGVISDALGYLRHLCRTDRVDTSLLGLPDPFDGQVACPNYLQDPIQHPG